MHKTLAILSAVLLCGSVFAMGGGNGVTKIDFKLKLGDTASSRIFAKLDVSAGMAQMTGGKGSANHALAGCTVDVTINSATFSGTADDKGKVATPFSAKVTGNGSIMQIKANGLNIEQLFPIDPTDGQHSVTVLIKVVATKTTTNADGTTASQAYVLSEQNVTFNYVTKKGQVKGKNF